MKSFQYTATNEWGETVSGYIESEHFTLASEIIKNKGLYIVSLHEVESDIQSMRGNVFSTFVSDEQTHPEHKTYKIEVVDEEQEKPPAEKIHTHETHHISVQEEVVKTPQEPKPIPQQEVHIPEPSYSNAKQEGGILFAGGSAESAQNTSISDADLEKLEAEIQQYIQNNDAALQDSTKERLQHYAGKIDLLRKTRDKKRLKNMRRELKRIKKIADREVEQHHQKEWESYEKKVPGNHVESYSEFGEQIKDQRVNTQQKLPKTGFKKWLQMIDLPDENEDAQVLFKQQYESIWNEAFLFSGVLLGFYLLTFFVAYYSKRSGVDENVLIRIFDTSLFKQLVLILFAFFGLLGLRRKILPKRLHTDIPLVLIFTVMVYLILTT